MVSSPRLPGDAGLGQSGALGELEAVNRWLSEGREVVVNKEEQNEKAPNGNPRKNPDYLVDGVLTEVKSRSEELDDRWVKREITKANKQMKDSGSEGAKGAVELQLRGEDAGRATMEQVERQVKGNFNSNVGRSLERVSVYKDGVLFGEWTRGSDGTVQRTFP